MADINDSDSLKYYGSNSALNREAGKPDGDTEPDLPPFSKQAVHDALHDANKNLPRFLFRTWHQFSGGHEDLNGPEQITPLAFATGAAGATSTIFDMQHQHLVQTIHDHTNTNWGIATFCTSWSKSLAFVISFAIGRDDLDNRQDHCISIVDVTKLDRRLNHVLWLAAEKMRTLRGCRTEEEFQIFGIVSGQALRSARLQDFLVDIHHLPRPIDAKLARWGHITKPSSPARWEDMSIEERNDRVQSAKKIGGLFGGGESGMVAAVFYLAAATPKLYKHGEVLLSLERAFVVDIDGWREDEGIMLGDYVSDRVTEVEAARLALRKIVKRADAK